jgi:HAE1 family hydrophobic/amphiphilic exporter-1
MLLGYISLKDLKLSFLPTVDFPRMWVVVRYPNQNPEILERLVARPMEEALSTLEGVKKIQSTTSADFVNLRLDFDWGDSLDLIRLNLGIKVEEARSSLPSGVQQVQIFSFNTSEIPVIQGRISAPGIDLSDNYDLLEKHVKQKLERVPGVAKVELQGVAPKEVFIDLRIDKILEHHIDVQSIINRLSQDNITIGAGMMKNGGLSYALRADGKIKSLDEFRNIVVHNRGILLRDIADITYEEPPIGYKRHLDGASALALEIYKESSANVVEVAREANRVIDEDISNDPLLKGISFFVWEDQAKAITEGLDSLTQSGLWGALFAILVLYVFLRRLDATLIVALSIPISIFGAFIWLYALNYTLNILTLMGLMLAVGMLVDNAVVVLESIYQKSLEGLSRREATMQGTREVIMALIAATLTTMIVFLSLVISDKNQLSIWLSSLGLTISFTLGTSLLVSITVIPLFTSKFLKPRMKENKPKRSIILTLYSHILNWSMKHQGWTGFILVALIASILFPATRLDQFEGKATKTSRLALEYEFHDFFFMSDVEKVINQVEAEIEPHRKDWGLNSVYSYMEDNNGVTILLFEDVNISPEQFKTIRKDLRKILPDVGGVTYRFDDDEEDSAQAIRVQLYGPDRPSLEKAGTQVVDILNRTEGLFDAKPNTPKGKQELRVVVNREKASRYGLSPQTVSQVFGFSLGGTRLPRFSNGKKETDVNLGLRIQDRATMEDVSKLMIGKNVRLGSVIEFKYIDQPDTIRRVNRKAFYGIRATYEGENFGDMKQAVEDQLNLINFPPGVSWTWSERMMREENEMTDMMFNLLIALILIYLVMASLFESLTQPLMILSTIVFSLVGVYWFLYVTGTSFEIMTTIGLMLLLGIVVNNGIVMMDHINQLKNSGLSLKEAVQRGAEERIRPILMTAGTTIFGMVPMAIGSSGIGDAYYFPLARCVIGGLFSSTLLTLVGLPFIILTSNRFWNWIKRTMSRLMSWKRLNLFTKRNNYSA